MRAFFGLLLGAQLAFSPAAQASAEAGYRLGAGDELAVSVALQGNLKDISQIYLYLPIQIVGDSVYSIFHVTIAPDGTISLPSLRQSMTAAGLTTTELEKELGVKLKLPSGPANVSVALLKGDSVPFFVWGEVNHAGRFIFDHPTSLLEALSYAGGPTNQARLNDVMLLRQNEKAQIVDMSAARLKKGMAPITLQPYDTLIVSRKRLADTNLWYLVFAALGTFATVKLATQ